MILHFLLGVAYATSFYIQPFSQFTQEATLIARGTLSNIHTENAIATDGSKIIYTYATLEVKEILKGSVPKQSILIREIGGTKDGYTVAIPGSPELKDGEDTVLFLGPEKEDQSHEITGLELGKYALEEKNGAQVLTGGIFNYAKHDEHNAAEAQPENLHPWSLAELRALVEKQGGKSAKPSSASRPNPGHTPSGFMPSAPATSSENVSPDSKSFGLPSSSPETKTGLVDISIMRYVAFGLAGIFLVFFLFRKR